MQKLERIDLGDSEPPNPAGFDTLQTEFMDQLPPRDEVLRPLSDLVRREVGRRSLPSLSDEIRRCMLVEAVRLNGGNITKAAIMLGLTRQAVQQMLANLELKDWASQLREIAGR